MHWCFASREEKGLPLAGDSVIASPFLSSTHAITIGKTPDVIWPWLVQMGQDKGGFYSYTTLENLIGCRMKNAKVIRPEWQNLNVGDTVQIHPKFHPLFVKQLDSAKSLVLWQQSPVFWTWSFNLRRADAGTRLLVRSRVAHKSLIQSLLLAPVMTCGHYVMERKMLTGIKNRCEKD